MVSIRDVTYKAPPRRQLPPSSRSSRHRAYLVSSGKMHLLGATIMPDLRLRLAVPPTTTVLLSLLFSLFLLLIIRIAVYALCRLSTVCNTNEKFSQLRPPQAAHHQEEPRGLHSISVWKWSWKWEGLPLASSMSFAPSESADNRTSVSAVSPQASETIVRVKGAGPTFDHPREHFL
jgi:hypothetical protein